MAAVLGATLPVVAVAAAVAAASHITASPVLMQDGAVAEAVIKIREEAQRNIQELVEDNSLLRKELRE